MISLLPCLVEELLLCLAAVSADPSSVVAKPSVPRHKSLPEFLLSTLESSRLSADVVRWEDREKGVFRILDGTRLAELWRQSRSKQRLAKYEFFARALR